MIERGSFDGYLRKENTALASALRFASGGKEGKDYRESINKRVVEVVITTPAIVLSAPIISGLAVAAYLEDGEAPFYKHKRIGKDARPLDVVKIRTMHGGAEGEVLCSPGSLAIEPEDDPRNTELGKKVRAYEFDELPQLLQVLKGDLSLVGIRCLPQYVFDYLEKEKPEVFAEWEQAYFEGTPSLFSLFSAMAESRKDNKKRHHYDLLYARKASLGLDLYILAKTGARMTKKLCTKVKRQVKNIRGGKE